MILGQTYRMRPAQESRGVTCPYGKPGSSWATGEHGGIDYGCPNGDPVYAMWAGTVTPNTWGSAYGTQLVIDHDKLPDGSPGLWAVYAHLSGREVAPGDRVTAGQLIGRSGATGNVSGPHLHVEVQRDSQWRQGNYVDPQPWVDAQEAGSEMWWSDYSGKPSGTLTITNAQDYEPLDCVTDDPPHSGLELHLLYVNCELTWADSPTMGIIRVKYVRDDGDDTAYQDYAVPAGESIGSPDAFLITASHWESGEKGKGGRWHLRAEGDLASVKLGTRYAKIAVIYEA